MTWRDNASQEDRQPAWVSAFAREARRQNCWIYDKISKRFFTAEELEAEWRSLHREHRKNGADNQGDFVLKVPEAAIKQRAEWVKKASQELDAVIQKYTMHLENSAKKKLK